MSQELTPVLQAVFSTLKTALPKVDFMMGDYAMDSYLPKVDANKLFKPYVLCKVHTAYETKDNGLGNKSEDPLQGSFSFYVVTPDGWVTQQVTDKIRATLRGKRFAGSGPVQVSGGYSFADADLGYHRYCQNIGFTATYNLGTN